MRRFYLIMLALEAVLAARALQFYLRNPRG